MDSIIAGNWGKICVCIIGCSGTALGVVTGKIDDQSTAFNAFALEEAVNNERLRNHLESHDKLPDLHDIQELVADKIKEAMNSDG